MMHIGDWMARGALYFPERLAVVDEERGAAGRFTYRQLNQRADRLAQVLRARGVGRGDRVGLVAYNGVAHLDAFFACGKLGAIYVPFNFRLHARELWELCQDTAPRVLLFGDEQRELVTQAAALGAREGRPGPAAVAPPALLGCEAGYEEALAAAAPGAVETPGVSEEDIACLLFTGGTTGKSKGARVSHRMIAWNTLTTLIHELQRDDVTVIHTPMFHTGGLLVYTLPLLVLGGAVVLLRRWDPERLLQVIARERVTLLFCVPTQFQQLLQTPGFHGADLSSLRFLTSGGAPLPVTLLQEFRAVHPVPFKQGFGMTEFGPGIFSMGPEFAETKAGSIGRPNYFIATRVVDDAGRDVPTGHEGELWLRGPAAFSGYYEAGGAGLSGFDAEGWFHTGDVCRVDEDGFYYIVDRKKDMFISGGENVYPTEIERALYEHGAVQQCAVVGIPDPKWGQVGHAFVVLRPGARASAEEIMAHLRQHLARYKVPKRVSFMAALPLSPAGKILKRALAP